MENQATVVKAIDELGLRNYNYSESIDYGRTGTGNLEQATLVVKRTPQKPIVVKRTALQKPIVVKRIEPQNPNAAKRTEDKDLTN